MKNMPIFLLILHFTFILASNIVPKSVEIGIFEGMFSADGRVDESESFIFSAMLLAIDQINTRKNLLPHTKLRFAVRSTYQGDFLATTRTAQELALQVFNGTGVKGVIGTGILTSSSAMAKVLGFTSTVAVDFGVQDSEMSHAEEFPFYARVNPSDGHNGIVLAQILKYHFGYTRVNVLATSDIFGSDSSALFLSEANRLGIYVENTYTYWPGTTDFTDLFLYLRQTGILKVFVIFSHGHDCGPLIEAGYNEGIFTQDTQLFGTTRMSNSDTWTHMSKTAPVAKIMKGTVGIIPYVNRSTESFQTFVKAYVNQSDTKIIEPDGSIKCVNNTDDDGNTFLFMRHGSHACGGVTFSSLKRDGSELDDRVAYAYDAVFALAHAIHIQIYEKKIYDFTGEDLYHNLLHQVNFTGATGFISFFQGLGGAEGFMIGDRQTDISYKLVNFNPIFYHKYGKELEEPIRTIGLWTTHDKSTENPEYNVFVACDVDHDNLCTDPIFNSKDGSQVEGSPRVTTVLMETWARRYLLAAAIICIITALWYIFMMVLFLDTRLIKSSQPGIMAVVLFGSLLGSIQILLQSMDVTDATCLAGMWLGHCAFALIFIALLVKTFLIASIIKNKFKKVKRKDSFSFMMSSVFCVFCLILVVDTFVGRPHQSFDDEFDGKQVIRHIRCRNDNPHVANTLFAIEGIVLFCAAKFCYDAKDAPNAVNDSGAISLSIYLILFVCAVTFPIVFLSIDPTPQNLALVMATGFFVAVIGVLNILFGRRTFLALDGADVDANFNIVKSGDSNKSSGSRASDMASRLTRKLRSRTLGGGSQQMSRVSMSEQQLQQGMSEAQDNNYSNSDGKKSRVPSLKRAGSASQGILGNKRDGNGKKLASVHEYVESYESEEVNRAKPMAVDESKDRVEPEGQQAVNNRLFSQRSQKSLLKN